MSSFLQKAKYPSFFHTFPMLHARNTVIAIATIAISTTFFALLPSLAHAEEAGTITVEQKGADYLGIQRLGKWGLATPVGVVEEELETFSENRIAGNYALTIRPPAGATQVIEVYEGGALIETFDSRTAHGEILSGSTLKFSIIYTFSLVGNVSVNSNPPNIPFELKGPAGSLKGKTPATFENRVEGAYTIYYKLPKACKPPPPISRKLESKAENIGRIGFSFESFCSALKKDTQPEKEEPKKEEEKPPVKKPARVIKNSVRVALSSNSAEVAAGGTASLSLVVLNRSSVALENLTVEVRYDGSKLSIGGARDARKSANKLEWTISSLPKGGKWQTNFSGNIADSIGNGDIVSASATVSGDDLKGVRSSQRSSSVQIGALKILPPTGAPLDLFALLALGIIGFMSLTVAGMQEFARR